VSANPMLLPFELSPPKSRDSIRAEVGHGGRHARVPAALDGHAPRDVDREHLEGRDLGTSAARKHGLTMAEVEEWRNRFLLGAENALRARRRGAA
jgi:hypothetical protein